MEASSASAPPLESPNGRANRSGDDESGGEAVGARDDAPSSGHGRTGTRCGPSEGRGAGEETDVGDAPCSANGSGSTCGGGESAEAEEEGPAGAGAKAEAEEEPGEVGARAGEEGPPAKAWLGATPAPPLCPPKGPCSAASLPPRGVRTGGLEGPADLVPPWVSRRCRPRASSVMPASTDASSCISRDRVGP